VLEVRAGYAGCCWCWYGAGAPPGTSGGGRWLCATPCWPSVWKRSLFTASAGSSAAHARTGGPISAHLTGSATTGPTSCRPTDASGWYSSWKRAKAWQDGRPREAPPATLQAGDGGAGRRRGGLSELWMDGEREQQQQQQAARMGARSVAKGAQGRVRQQQHCARRTRLLQVTSAACLCPSQRSAQPHVQGS
jgi:hypothetical protein